jgi:predicted nuclease of restriction endonuclease-like (RecB) superfamily
VLRLLPKTQNLIILNQDKRLEEREFYLRIAIQERWSSRELEHLFEGVLAGLFASKPAPTLDLL